MDHASISGPNIYQTIYKYVSPETLRKILSNKSLKFSIAQDFNDPFDCYPQLLEFNVTEVFLQSQIKRGILELNEFEKKLTLAELVGYSQKRYYNHENPDISDLLKGILYGWKISCFSKKKDNILMWSHYSDKHKGACIGFNLAGLLETLSFLLLEVKYVQDFLKFDMCKNEQEAITYAFSTKSIEWKYEEEIRLVVLDGSKSSTDCIFLPISPLAISEIYLGCNFQDCKSFTEEYFNSDYTHISFQKMVKSTNSFGLRATPVFNSKTKSIR